MPHIVPSVSARFAALSVQEQRRRLFQDDFSLRVYSVKAAGRAQFLGVAICQPVERVEGFTDAVTLAISFDYFKSKFGEQLPPGVTMAADSKARLTGDVLEGKIVLEATDKAVAVDRLPIAVRARVSITFSITTNYASNPVFLTIKNAE